MNNKPKRTAPNVKELKAKSMLADLVEYWESKNALLRSIIRADRNTSDAVKMSRLQGKLSISSAMTEELKRAMRMSNIS